jgi:hypothetical protein
MTAKAKTPSPVSNKGPVELAAAREKRKATKLADAEAQAQRWDANRAVDNCTPEVMTSADMLTRCVDVHGEDTYVTTPPEAFATSGKRLKPISGKAFKAYYAGMTEEVTGDKKPAASAALWLQNPKRKIVDAAGLAIGLPRFYPYEGKQMVNIWTPRKRQPSSSVDITPFLEHIRYLIADDEEREQFLDWLAHCEQAPQVLPEFGYLLYSPTLGTGRSWLAKLFREVWPGECASGVDLSELLSSKFNGEIAGNRMACVEEVYINDPKEQRKQAPKLRNIMNEGTRLVKPKYGREYTEKNSLRWLMFTNHDDAVPMDEKERRIAVINTAVELQSPEYYTRLYSFLTPEFGAAVGAWLAERDISKFNPGWKPPLNAAKLAVIRATTTQLELDLSEVLSGWKAEGVQWFGAGDLQWALDAEKGPEWNAIARPVGNILKDLDVEQVSRNRMKGMKGARERLYAFKGAEGVIIDIAALEKARKTPSHPLHQGSF